MRSKITAAFAMCIALPVAAGMGALWLGTEDTLRQQSFDDLQTQTRNVMVSIEQQMASNLTHMKAWSSMPMMQEVLIGDQGGELAATLADLNRSYPDFLSLTITNAQGAVIATTDPALRKADLSDVEGIHAAISGRTTQSGFTRLRSGASEAIQFTVPLVASYDRQTVIGTLTGVVDFQTLVKRTLQGSPLNQERRVFALTRRDTGKVLYANRSIETVADEFAGIDTNRRITTAELMLSGEESLAAFSRSSGKILGKDPGLVAFGAEPLSSVYAAADKVSNIFAAIAGLAAAFALFIAWRWATPLVELSDSIGRLARGDSRTPVPEMPSHSAFAPLTRALESMKSVRSAHDALAARERELVEANDKAQAEIRLKEKQLQDLGHALQARMTDIVEMIELINRENLAAAAARRQSPHMVELNRTATELLNAVQGAIEASEAAAERVRKAPALSDTPALQRLSA